MYSENHRLISREVQLHKTEPTCRLFSRQGHHPPGERQAAGGDEIAAISGEHVLQDLKKLCGAAKPNQRRFTALPFYSKIYS